MKRTERLTHERRKFLGSQARTQSACPPAPGLMPPSLSSGRLSPPPENGEQHGSPTQPEAKVLLGCGRRPCTRPQRALGKERTRQQRLTLRGPRDQIPGPCPAPGIGAWPAAPNQPICTPSRFQLLYFEAKARGDPSVVQPDREGRAAGCFSHSGRDRVQASSFPGLFAVVPSVPTLGSQGTPLGLGAGLPFSASPSPWNFPLQLPPLPDTPPWAQFPAPSASHAFITPPSHPRPRGPTHGPHANPGGPR